MREKRATLESQKQGVPINGSGDIEGHQGEANQGPGEVFRIDRPPLHFQVGGEKELPFFTEDHIDLKIFRGLAEAPVILHIHPDKGRYMKLFVKLMIGAGLFISALPFKALGIALPPGGIGDLGHQGDRLGLFLVP